MISFCLAFALVFMTDRRVLRYTSFRSILSIPCPILWQTSTCFAHRRHVEVFITFSAFVSENTRAQSAGAIKAANGKLIERLHRPGLADSELNLESFENKTRHMTVKEDKEREREKASQVGRPSGLPIGSRLRDLQHCGC